MDSNLKRISGEETTYIIKYIKIVLNHVVLWEINKNEGSSKVINDVYILDYYPQ